MKMRIIIIFSILILITACKNADKQVEVDKTEISSTISTDSTSNPEILKISSKYPEWLNKLYPNKIEYGPKTIDQKIDNLEKINDSVFYITYSQSDGVCSIDYLVTFLNRQKQDSLNITDICDHELSFPTYSWKETGIINKTRIVVMDYNEKVVDSLIDANGKIKNNLDFLEAETTVDSTLTEYKIDEIGRIKK